MTAAGLTACALALLLSGCATPAARFEPPPPADAGDGGFSAALALYARGLLLEAENTPAAREAALAAYGGAHRLDPLAAAPFMRCVVGMMQAGHSNEVLAVTARNARHPAARPEAWAIYGSVAEESGRYREAARAFARYRGLRAQNEPDWEVSVAEIRNWFLDGSDGRALGRLRWLVAQTNLPPQAADVALQWARHFILKERRPQRALPVIDLMVDVATNAADKAAAITFRGDAQMLAGSTNSALRSYWQALDVEPAYNPAAQRLGGYLAGRAATNCLEKGEQALGRERSPMSRALVYASAWGALGDETRAAGVLLAGRRAVRQRQIAPSAQYELALGAVLDDLGRDDEAAAVFLDALSVHEDAHMIMNHLAYMWAVNNVNLAEAQRWSEKALTYEPDNYAYLDTLGWIYFRQGRNYEALSQLLLAARLSPVEDSVIFDHVGDVLAAMGRHAEAVSFWRRALKRDKNGEMPELGEKIERSLRLVNE